MEAAATAAATVGCKCLADQVMCEVHVDDICCALRVGDVSLLTAGLRPIMLRLLDAGYGVTEVQRDFHNRGAFMVVLDRPVTEEFRSLASLSADVEEYADYDRLGRLTGLGFHSSTTLQCIQGPEELEPSQGRY
jgi:hypothetical protein